jgi:hypothetical protein
LILAPAKTTGGKEAIGILEVVVIGSAVGAILPDRGRNELAGRQRRSGARLSPTTIGWKPPRASICARIDSIVSASDLASVSAYVFERVSTTNWATLIAYTPSRSTLRCGPFCPFAARNARTSSKLSAAALPASDWLGSNGLPSRANT